MEEQHRILLQYFRCYEGHCSTGQSSHRAVVPVEEEEEEDFRCYACHFN
jgi:hypothetical protein